jgi:hypothetical protein
MNDAPPDKPRTFLIQLNLREIFDIASVGVRRASAFLSIALTHNETEDIEDFNLGQRMIYQFWPTPLPPDMKSRAIDEFQHWIVGTCLRELDQYFSMFLDKCWWAIEVIDVAGNPLPENFEFDGKFEGFTNVGKKYFRVCEKLDIAVHEDSFASLSLVRNALAHGSGQVRTRDCNKDATLQVSWLAFELSIQDGDKKHVISRKPFDPISVKKGQIIEYGSKEVSKTFELGERIQLSLHDIAEICFFYHSCAGQIHDAMGSMAEAKQASIDSKK